MTHDEKIIPRSQTKNVYTLYIQHIGAVLNDKGQRQGQYYIKHNTSMIVDSNDLYDVLCAPPHYPSISVTLSFSHSLTHSNIAVTERQLLVQLPRLVVIETALLIGFHHGRCHGDGMGDGMFNSMTLAYVSTCDNSLISSWRQCCLVIGFRTGMWARIGCQGSAGW